MLNEAMIERMSNKCHVMLDIEALGNGAGGVVTSIGALQFTPLTGETHSEFKVNIGIQSALNKGMRVDGSTIEWWFTQSVEAQKAMLVNPFPIEEALSSFSKWTTELLNPTGTLFSKKEIYWWANGANYDFVLLGEAYKACGKDWVPWHYPNLIDYRTLKNVVGYKAPDSYFDESAHDALADCYRQVKMVKDVMDIMSPVFLY